MKEQHYDYAVFIGRFQPFHIGHLHVFQEALQHSKQLIVLVGSSGGTRTLRNPFTFAERAAMITSSLPESIRSRVILEPLADFIYDDQAWVIAVSDIVEKRVNSDAKRIALVGHDKDETTYYLTLFPNWAYIEVGNLDGISSTPVRKSFFSCDKPTQFNSEVLLPETQSWLRVFADSLHFSEITAEYRAIQHFKSSWSNAPYPVIFTTTDALVRYHDEILLITRKNYPGKGLFALPGGFLDAEETLLDGCLRELSEETHLSVDRETLLNALVCHRVFDDPKRDSRGRVVTYGYYFDISALPQKPSTQADDDATSVSWVSLAQLDNQDCNADHFFIIQALLKQSLTS